MTWEQGAGLLPCACGPSATPSTSQSNRTPPTHPPTHPTHRVRTQLFTSPPPARLHGAAAAHVPRAKFATFPHHHTHTHSLPPTPPPCRALLQRMSPEHKFATAHRLCQEVLSGAADGALPLEECGEVLGDALRILASKHIKVCVVSFFFFFCLPERERQSVVGLGVWHPCPGGLPLEEWTEVQASKHINVGVEVSGVWFKKAARGVAYVGAAAHTCQIAIGGLVIVRRTAEHRFPGMLCTLHSQGPIALARPPNPPLPPARCARRSAPARRQLTTTTLLRQWGRPRASW